LEVAGLVKIGVLLSFGVPASADTLIFHLSNHDTQVPDPVGISVGLMYADPGLGRPGTRNHREVYVHLIPLHFG
jgi:hypothetical protein